MSHHDAVPPTLATFFNHFDILKETLALLLTYVIKGNSLRWLTLILIH